MTTVTHFLAIEGGDDVAALQAGFFSRAPRSSVSHHHARVLLQSEFPGQRRSNILDVHTHEAADYLAFLDQAFHDHLGQVDGHGETDPLIAAAAAEDGRIDADQSAFRVDEGAAGVA